MYQYYRALLVLLMWGVWLARNKVIFQDVKAHAMVYASKSVSILESFPQMKATNKRE